MSKTHKPFAELTFAFTGVFLALIALSGDGVVDPVKSRFSSADTGVTAVQRAITIHDAWLNTSRALRPDDLEGRIILLDFWSYCCINCMHLIPELETLETEFGPDLTVIGVHSAKFDNEKDTENIRAAVLRYGIEHPVVNDSDFAIWQTFAVKAWPTQVLINPSGKVEQVYSGEGHLNDIRQDVTRLRREFAGKINLTPLPMALEKSKLSETVLSYPGKIATDGRELLFIADSSHHRILGARLNGEVVFSVGKVGERGKTDGDFEEARFSFPQGLVYRNSTLYVADTENHLLRKVDLKTRKVSTVAGTGVQGVEHDVKDAPALESALSSPWDLAFYPTPGDITIAMAGLHQLWVYNIEARTLSVLAGSGREAIDDGPYPMNSLSQPSGLSASDEKLYFVDSETSSLRILEARRVRTLLGTGLFDFGFKDGVQGHARLQHPLGVFANHTGIYVADSYNHALRRYDPKTGKIETLTGGNKRGYRDGKLKSSLFNEPGGLIKIGSALYVADTNNNQIRVVDLQKKATSTLKLFFSSEMAASSIESEPSQGAPRVPEIEPKKIAKALPNLQKAAPARVLAGKPVTIKLAVDKGWKLNEAAPSWVALYKPDGELLREFHRAELEKFQVVLPALEADQDYRLQGTFYYCEERKGALCMIQSHDQVLKTGASGAQELLIELR